MESPSTPCEPKMVAVLYVRHDCLFSELARGCVFEVAQETGSITVELRDQSEAAAEGIRVVATPTLVLPGGYRLTGTPSVRRLQGVFAEILGKEFPVPNKVWYLQHNRLFRGVPLKEIEKFAHLFHEQDFKPKDVVFAEGDLGNAIYLLKRGYVRLFRLTEDGKELTLAILGPGDVFGELALFKEAQRQTFAEALEDAHICAASVEDFTRLMAHRPQLTMMVAGEIARRRSEMETRIAGLAYGSVRARLLHALRHLAREHGEPQADGKVRIALHLSHQELAQLIGATRETCTIELGKLQKSSIVCFDDDRRLVIDPTRLEPGLLDRVLRTVIGTQS